MSKTNKLEMTFAVIGLMFFAGVFTNGFSRFFPGPSISLIRYSIFGGTLVLLFQRWRGTLQTALRGGWIWGLLLLLGVSFIWAESPGFVFTGVRAELIPMGCFSLYLGSRFTIQEQFQATTWAFGLSLLLSALLVFGNPSLSVHFDPVHYGAWKGVFSHKNDFSAYSVLTTSSFFLAAIYARSHKLLMWTLYAACIAAVLLSTSKTGLVLSIAGLIIIIIYRSFRWVGIRSVLILDLSIFVMGGLVGILLVAWDPIMIGIGRDPTLNARTLIWEFLIDYKIPDSPFIGYGRGMFWASPSLSNGIEAAALHIPAHSHNGFIDLTLDVGLLGMFFFALTFVVTYIKSLRISYINKTEAAYQWPSVFLTLMLLNNYTESFITRLTNLFWVIFVMLVFTLNREKPSEL